MALGAAAFAGVGTVASQPTSAFATPGVVDNVGALTPASDARGYGIAPYKTPRVTFEQARDNSPRRVLIVVDYQNDFVGGGPFGDIPTAKAIEEALAARVEEYYAAGDIVIYTMDTHPNDHYADTREGSVNPEHCVPGTNGWEIHGMLHDLLTPERAIRVLKGTYGSPDLPFVVKNIINQGTRVEYIEFAGVSTTCRVLHNAIMIYNFFPELPLVFDETTTASYSDEQTLNQLDELESWGFIVKRKQ